MKVLELKHYASKYYDPIAAHEYYLRTRQLRPNKRSTAALSDEGKKKWATVKETINDQRKTEIKRITDRKAADVKRYREAAKKKTEDIAAALKSKMEILSKRASFQSSNLANKRNTEMKQLQSRLEAQVKEPKPFKEIPAGASESQIKAINQQNKQINKQNIMDAQMAAKQQQNAVMNIQKEFQQKSSTNAQAQGQESAIAQADAEKEKAAVKATLTKGLETAKNQFTQKKIEIDNRFEGILDKEYAAIAKSSSSGGPTSAPKSDEEQKKQRAESYAKRETERSKSKKK